MCQNKTQKRYLLQTKIEKYLDKVEKNKGLMSLYLFMDINRGLPAM